MRLTGIIGTICIVAGLALDFSIGDPVYPFHPVRLIGHLITGLEGLLLRENQSPRTQRIKGGFLVLMVLAVAVSVTLGLLILAYSIHPLAGILLQALFTYQALATKSLKLESMRVYYALKQGNLPEAREKLSRIVGRDTSQLSPQSISKATVETVAENTSDGCIAPLFYLALGGPVLGFLYKAVNTMDSMIGYQNDHYQYFGTCAARLDDVMNYVPARLSACLMILAARLIGIFSRERAYFDGRSGTEIWKRDRRKHSSPNAAQTEAACAGILHVMLGGDALYFGKLVKKQTLGDDKREIEVEDIRRANVLLYGTVLCMALLVIAVRVGVGRIYGTF